MAKDPLVMSDVVSAQLVDCTPPEPQEPIAPTPTEPPSPTAQARDATLGQTGADPPPGISQSSLSFLPRLELI